MDIIEGQKGVTSSRLFSLDSVRASFEMQIRLNYATRN